MNGLQRLNYMNRHRDGRVPLKGQKEEAPKETARKRKKAEDEQQGSADPGKDVL